MAAFGGYDVKCVEAVPNNCECSICNLILRKPVQTACGHRFCRDCLNACFDQCGEYSECPIDRKDIDYTKVFDDKAFERDILNIKVKCSNHKVECDWTGELRDLETHVNVHCPKQKVLCQNEGCDMLVLRSNVEDHMTNSCQYRYLDCIYCTREYKYVKQEVHWKYCLQFPLSCGNCGETKIPRIEMPEHLSKCPLTVVPCPYANIGCSVRFSREAEETHMQCYMKNHLQLSIMKMANFEKTMANFEKTCKKQRELIKEQQTVNKKLKRQIRALRYSQANSFIMKILNFEEKIKLERITGKPIYSEPHIINCYKMRLQVYLIGDEMGRGKFLSIYFQLMKGQFDDCLSWPFTKQIIITLLHPKEEETFERALTLTDDDEDKDCYEKPSLEYNEPIGCPKFIDYDSLCAKGYLSENKLFIRCKIGQ